MTPASSRHETHVRAMLTAFARRVERLEVNEARPFINNLVHGLDALPVTIS